jgi:threonine dehydratase
MVLKAIYETKTSPKGLVAASAGNHAQGVALVAAKVGLPCTIVCPEYAPETKLSWTRQYGAEVIKKGINLEEALDYAEKICKEREWMFVKPFNDVDIIEGQGTLGYEIHQVIPDVDTVLVNVGGGGVSNNSFVTYNIHR